jgi:hypothetical protein
MLAEAVRNTQPQPLDPQAEPARNDTPAAKRASPTRHTRTTQGRTAKTNVFAQLAVSGNLDNADVLTSSQKDALRSRWVTLSPRGRTVEQKAACE